MDDDWIGSVVEHFGWKGVAGLLAIVIAFDRTGFIQTFTRRWGDRRQKSSELALERDQRLDDRLEGAIVLFEKRWRDEVEGRVADRAAYERQIAELQTQIRAKDAALQTATAVLASAEEGRRETEKGNARQRHDIENMRMIIRNLARIAGVDVPAQYQMMPELSRDDPELAEKLYKGEDGE